MQAAKVNTFVNLMHHEKLNILKQVKSRACSLGENLYLSCNSGINAVENI